MLEPKVGLVSLSSPVFVKMFERFDEYDIKELALNVGKYEIRDIVLFMKGRWTLESISY
jgi:hypothetical protein